MRSREEMLKSLRRLAGYDLEDGEERGVDVIASEIDGILNEIYSMAAELEATKKAYLDKFFDGNAGNATDPDPEPDEIGSVTDYIEI